MHKKAITILALAAVYFAAVPLLNKFLPEPTNPTSSVAFHSLEIPGLECEQNSSYLSDAPAWDCPGATIYAEKHSSLKTPEEYVARQHRAFRFMSELPSAEITQMGDNLYRLDDADAITVAADQDGSTPFFYLEGPDAPDYASKIEVHA